MNNINLDLWIEKLLTHDRGIIAKTITYIESTKPEHQNFVSALFEKLHKNAKHSFKMGISGPPGVGKSTLINALGPQLIQKGESLAVLTYDPSSPRTGGSLLGDKTRMSDLSQCPNVYIRPSPSKTHLGGLGPRTFDTLRFLEMIGFDTIILESVGVGQSEVELATLTDFFILLLPPGGGDELQGLKKGILEFCDLIVINKAEDENAILAKKTAQDYGIKGTTVEIISAFHGTNISKILDVLKNERKICNQKKNKTKNIEFFLIQEFKQLIEDKIKSNDHLKSRLNSKIEDIQKKGISIHQAAKDFAVTDCFGMFWAE
jgi:LAO/AO transport system kinase